jgi:hypothetical protein
MTTPRNSEATGASPANFDFSLAIGGPLYQLWRRTRLCGDELELLRRRMFFFVLVSWLPLLVLSMLAGRAWGDAVAVTFIRDLEMHARLLVALPLLLAAERTVHQWTREAVHQFIAQSLVPEHERGRFQGAVDSALRLRNSLPMEVILLVLVYALGVGYLATEHVKTIPDAWYGSAPDGTFSLSPAGWWALLVSLPMFQFLLVRWFYRIFIWGRLLFQFSRLELNYLPNHPDRCGGLGFLSTIGQGFGAILLAVSTVVSGVIADQVLYQGAKLPSFTVEVVGILLLLLISLLGPLLFFSPGMLRAKMRGQSQLSELASRFVYAFNRKWIESGPPPGEPMLGHPDFSSLADLGGSYAVLEEMRWAPLRLVSVAHFVGVALLPLAPLLLTQFSLDELIRRVVEILF